MAVLLPPVRKGGGANGYIRWAVSVQSGNHRYHHFVYDVSKIVKPPDLPIRRLLFVYIILQTGD